MTEQTEPILVREDYYTKMTRLTEEAETMIWGRTKRNL